MYQDGPRHQGSARISPFIPHDQPLPLGWCCHTPRWVTHTSKRSHNTGYVNTFYKCSRCQWEGFWENGNKMQVYTPKGDRIAVDTIRELSVGK
jgi:hypothetical protein